MNVDVRLSDEDLDVLAERLVARLPKADTGSPWMTIEPAAQYLGTSTEALGKAARRNQVPHHQPTGFRGRLLFRKDELDEWVTA